MPLPSALPLAALAAIANSSQDGWAWFDAQDRLVWANPKFHLWLGDPALEIPRSRLIAQLGPANGELTHLGPGHQMVLVIASRLLECSVISAGDGVAWIIRDISAELRLLAQLAEEASLLAHGVDAFFIVDRNGMIRYANAVAEAERGASLGGLMGRSLASLERLCTGSYQEPKAHDQAALVMRLSQIANSGSPLRYPALHVRLDGTEIPVDCALRPHRLRNESVLLLNARDDSPRLMHLQALIKAKGEAESANRAKSAFLAITSHELRTPLTGIIGFCELLQLEVGTAAPAIREASQSYLKLIAESSSSLLVIINDIMDLAKIESRTLEIRPGIVDPVHQLKICETLWQERSHAKGLKLVLRPPVGIHQMISTDAQRLRQILENLISNAVKFTHTGRIEISCTHLHEAVEFTIADTGPGIPTENHESIFKAFWQSADHHTRAQGGTGLGLYFCASVASLLGGKVWLAHSSAAGSVFKLHLPRAATPRPSARLLKSDQWIKTADGGLKPLSR